MIQSRKELRKISEDELNSEPKRLQAIYHLDFTGHPEQFYQGEALYKTIEHLRKRSV